MMLILSPLSMAVLFAWVTAGSAPGLGGHSMGYLQATCVVWGIIMTVVPIFRLIRLVALPLWFLVIMYADMYMFPVTVCLGMYHDIYWWANTTHVASSMVVAAIILLALCKTASYCPPHVNLGGKGGTIALMAFLSMSTGAIWELMEGFTDIIAGSDYMVYGPVNCIGNLSGDFIGTALMVPIAMYIFTKYSVGEIASKVRLGKKNIDVSR
jgi:hypothetical protein